MRAPLVPRAEPWRWGSLAQRLEPPCREELPVLADWPVSRPRNWLALVQQPQTERELEAVRLALQRGLGPATRAGSVGRNCLDLRRRQRATQDNHLVNLVGANTSAVRPRNADRPGLSTGAVYGSAQPVRESGIREGRRSGRAGSTCVRCHRSPRPAFRSQFWLSLARPGASPAQRLLSLPLPQKRTHRLCSACR